MIATAIYCVSRLIIARIRHRAAEHDVDLMHAIMGVAMAGMLVTSLNPLPNGVWAGLFGGATAWFGWRISRAYRSRPAEATATGHHVPHLVMCGAMVYMLLAVAVAKSRSAVGGMVMGGAGGARFPAVALILALFMFGYVMWQADRLPALSRVRIPQDPQLAGEVSADALTGAAGRPAALAEVATGGMPSTASAASAGGAATGTSGPGGWPLSPRLAACCQMAMGITMGYMLIMML
jgi:hypothetical protein